MPLEKYREKRDFARTPEPTGGAAGGGALRFVVQLHHARQLHYDFRLELGGVLLSWAVPKGPSLDPADKHLAVHVEDHPLDYAGFEGTIPAGEYGAGSVIVWDSGTWEPVGDAEEGLARGDLKFTLHGQKLQGLWVLVRLKPRPGEKRENWLLIKERDEFARRRAEYDLLAERPESVVSGLRVDEVGVAGDAAAGAGSVGGFSASTNADPPAPPPASPSGTRPSGRGASPSNTQTTPQPTSQSVSPQAALGGPEAAPFPKKIDVELATLVSAAPSGDEWIAEVKYDGYRIALALDDGVARAYSRSHADWSDKFAPLARAAERLPASSAILDGEAVVLDDDGISRFELLQVAIGQEPERIVYAAFDLLYLNGYDLRQLPLLKRKELLRELLGESASPLFYADHLVGNAGQFYDQACRADLEGCVCKRADSRYRAGRGRDWLKVKCRLEQEFVVGGFSEGGGSRTGFGALLVGTYDGDRLVYHGRVGTGFSAKTLGALRTRLDALKRKTSPFDPSPHITDVEVQWVSPKLVIEVAFREWTSDGILRQPAFLGVREDKAARDVVRETPGAQRPPGGSSRREPTGARPSDGLRALPETPDRPASSDDEAHVLDVKITNPSKRLFPESDFTKLELALYYSAVAPVMLPEVAERPLTLLRCPVGGGEGCFYQRHPDAGLPASIHTLPYVLKGEPTEYLWIDSAEGLVSIAQMGVLEVHVWGSRVDEPRRPDRMIFDLDPGPDVAWEQIVSAARLVRDECVQLGFAPFLKSTGSKGLHVVLPIEPVWEFDRVRALSKAIVDRVSDRHPDELTGNFLKTKRMGRVYFDYLRNAETASAVAAYSTRNRPGPSCAVPLEWDELATSLDIRAFTPERVMERVAAGIDPWTSLAEKPAGSRVMRAAESALEG